MHWIDPESLPEIRGRFDRFLLNPRGDADGLLLDDGREVHFPPHMGQDIVAGLENARGAELRIRALRPRAGDVFAAVAVAWEGACVEDRGPPEKPAKTSKSDVEPQARIVEGLVRRPLHGPKGETRGVLLESGEIVRFAPHAAEGAREALAPGARFAARGTTLKTRLGEVMEAEAFGPGREALGASGKPKKPKKPANR